MTPQKLVKALFKRNAEVYQMSERLTGVGDSRLRSSNLCFAYIIPSFVPNCMLKMVVVKINNSNATNNNITMYVIGALLYRLKNVFFTLYFSIAA
jgi:hypothetical protein